MFSQGLAVDINTEDNLCYNQLRSLIDRKFECIIREKNNKKENSEREINNQNSLSFQNFKFPFTKEDMFDFLKPLYKLEILHNLSKKVDFSIETVNSLSFYKKRPKYFKTRVKYRRLSLQTSKILLINYST